ncbi:MAG TPA: HWE histidine kinase domain-containing protein [Xanthobacteraceae bacterium]|jgi:two-component sensor histidine kinase|nr:HWE histidine kinase domain-containing protein [Xanthobacteraceae bacterium]
MTRTTYDIMPPTGTVRTHAGFAGAGIAPTGAPSAEDLSVASETLGKLSDLVNSAPINILIVDDEPKNLTVLETVLADPSYRLVRAESAEQALLALLVDDFALLILDIRMPATTGFELAQTIKARKKNANVPIIFLTAYYNEDQHIIEGYGAGAVDYLHKPVNVPVLRSKVGVFAELYRKQRHLEAVNRALLAEVGARGRVEEELRLLNNTLEARVHERTEHIRHLMNEVDHRSKNLLALVQAIARQTAAAVPDDFVSRFSERLQALAASHDLLVKSRWQGVELAELLRAQLAHLADVVGPRLVVEGEPLRISSSAAQTIGMAIHELATNAVKYGALSNAQGRVELRWQVEHQPPPDQFVMSWIEFDGPEVVMPIRRGFGSTVLKTIAKLSLEGHVELEFVQTGVNWRLTCPFSKVLDAEKAHDDFEQFR